MRPLILLLPPDDNRALSGTTLVAVLALYLFGGSALAGFAFTVLVGIIAGTWSSVFVAAPMAALAGRARG